MHHIRPLPSKGDALNAFDGVHFLGSASAALHSGGFESATLAVNRTWYLRNWLDENRRLHCPGSASHGTESLWNWLPQPSCAQMHDGGVDRRRKSRTRKKGLAPSPVPVPFFGAAVENRLLGMICAATFRGLPGRVARYRNILLRGLSMSIISKLLASVSGSQSRRPPQPLSVNTLHKHSRTEQANVTHSICPYCAVGCATDIYTKGQQVINIEGNPNSPINEGTLCPKGANIFQLHHNPHRLKEVLWRAPYSDRWESKPLEWAVDRIAQLVKQARDEGYQRTSEKGLLLNAVKNIGTLGGATLDNEENYLIKKLFGAGLQVVSIENQARI